jgi:glycosyltransferase involved in cell wall biosynthesis
VISIITTTSPVAGETERFVAAVAAFVPAAPEPLELLLVDDLRLLDVAGMVDWEARHGFLRVLRPSRRGQLGAGIQALAEVRGEIAVTMDPDMAGNLPDINRFLMRYREGCRLVYGRRTCRGDVPPLRHAASRLYNGIIRRVFRIVVTDINTPMLLVARSLFSDIVAYDGRHGSAKVYFPHTLGARFAEVDITVAASRRDSSYTWHDLFGLMLRQLGDLVRFARARRQGSIRGD